MPWASMWTSGWSSLVPSGSLSWEWATMTGSECSKPSLSCWASPPWDPRAPAVRCQGPSGPGVGCGTGAECKAMVSAETPCHTGKGVAHPPAPRVGLPYFSPPLFSAETRHFWEPWVTSLGAPTQKEPSSSWGHWGEGADFGEASPLQSHCHGWVAWGLAQYLFSPAWRRISSHGESSFGRPCVSTLGWRPPEKSPGERMSRRCSWGLRLGAFCSRGPDLVGCRGTRGRGW